MEMFIIGEEEHKQRLDLVFNKHFPDFTRAHIKTLIENGDIILNGQKVKAGALVKTGQHVEYKITQVRPLDARPEDIDFDIIYEDDDLVVVNKPQGLVVHPCSSTKEGTLVNGLLFKIKDLSGINGVLRPGIVHRLDKNTSGLMVVAKNDMAHVSLASQIKDKTCQRKYLALLEGNLKDNEGDIQTYIDRSKSDRKKMTVSDKGRLALTHYKVLKRYTTACLVEFALKTGRTHQIRVHAKQLGHPVVGDDVYGHKVSSLDGQLLHSYSLAFCHPRTNKNMHFEIDLPLYFQNHISKLREI